MQPESGELKPRLSLTNTLQPVCYQQRHTQIPRQPGVSLQSIRGFCSVFDVKQLLSWSDRRVQTAEFLCVSASPLHCELDAVALLQDLHQCLGVVLRRLLQGDSLGQTVGHHTAGVLLDPLIRHRDQAALPHSLTWTQHMIITAGYRQSLIWLLQSVTGYPASTQDCETVSFSSHMLMETLTVKHSEDFLHHLPQDEDVGLSVWWSSRFPVLAVLTQFAEIAFLVFGMGIRCGHVLQTWHPWSQTIQVLS